MTRSFIPSADRVIEGTDIFTRSQWRAAHIARREKIKNHSIPPCRSRHMVIAWGLNHHFWGDIRATVSCSRGTPTGLEPVHRSSVSLFFKTSPCLQQQTRLIFL